MRPHEHPSCALGFFAISLTPPLPFSFMEKMTAGTKEAMSAGGKNPNKVLDLKEVAEHTSGKDYVTVLKEMRGDVKPLIDDLEKSSPNWVKTKFKDRAEMEETLKALRESNEKRFKMLDANQKFKETMQRESWGKWALKKAKQVLTYPVRHPLKTVGYALLVVAAVAGTAAVGAYMAGGLEALLAKVGVSYLFGASGAATATDVLGKVIHGAEQLPAAIAPDAGKALEMGLNP